MGTKLLGIKCPYCKSANVFVVDTRPQESSRRRRYMCNECGERFNTIEIDESLYLKMAKIVRIVSKERKSE